LVLDDGQQVIFYTENVATYPIIGRKISNALPCAFDCVSCPASDGVCGR